MGSDDLLSPEGATTYHRAYELASQLVRNDKGPAARGYRTSLAEDWFHHSILVQVLRRLDGGHREDPGLILMAIQDALTNRRSVATGLSDSGLL